MPFFETKKAAAILKHAILDQYVDPFASKTGSTAPGHRVAFIDGHAGEGRYENGDEGSPALLIRKAHALAPGRTLECFFVEEDQQTFERLRDLVADEGHGLKAVPVLGRIEDHLEPLLSQVAGIPVFVFLDPYGLMVPFDIAVKVLDRLAGYGVPATEMLINFNAGALRRTAGHLTSDKGSEATLARMDAVCGGSWWRTSWLDQSGDKVAAEEAVVHGYAQRFATATKCGFWIAEVRNRASLKPIYHLVFLTRHRDGMSVFGEALSLGLQRWREAVHRVENKDSLFEGDEAFRASEETLAAGWIDEIEKNLRRLLVEGQSFTIIGRYSEVYGKAVGEAREKHLRAAWRALYEEGVTKTDPKGKLIAKLIEPA